jgi:hypothetical protein
MKPIKFPQANTNLIKPDDMTDEQCGELPVYRGAAENGFPVYISCFELDEQELLDVLQTKKIWVHVYAASHPPIALDCADPWRKNDRGEKEA